nr:MAG: rep protein [Cressdnaviricota sp.]
MCHYRGNTMSAHSGTEHIARYWTGVLNNYTEDELSALTQLDCPELVIDKEVGKEGTPHLHIYLKLEKKARLTKLKDLCPRAHWEVVHDREATIRYCSKGDVVVSRLIAPVARKRLSAALEVFHRAGVAGVAREAPEEYVLHHRGFQALEYQLLSSVPKPVPVVSWYYGETGTGKTFNAYKLANEGEVFMQYGPNQKGGAVWWDGYLGQKVVVLDDFRPWWIPFDFLLNLLDRYPIRVQVKGGFVNFIPE